MILSMATDLENVLTRFRSIEGLRGWLAWTVVLSHVAYASGIYIKGLGPFLGRTGVCISFRLYDNKRVRDNPSYYPKA
jgi:peptidoglycan/LPS O-acetylase OafA/YrhL